MIRGRHTRLTRPLQYLALAAFMVFLAFPVVFLLVTALKPQSEFARSRPVVPSEGDRVVELHRSDRQDPVLDDRPQQRSSWRP